jgi:hypothetical protein
MSEDYSGDPYPPYRRKNGYKELADKIDEHTNRVEERFRKFLTKALMAFAVLGFTSAGALLGFGVVLKEQNKTDKLIQDQRYEYIYQDCVDQNSRHDNAVRRARELFPGQTRKTVTEILDELQPVRDCKALANRRVRGD